MRLGTVECQKVPNDAPGDSDRTRRVEDRTPAEVRDQESAQRIGYADADAEALEAGHEAASLRDGDPVADEGVHRRPRQALKEESEYALEMEVPQSQSKDTLFFPRNSIINANLFESKAKRLIGRIKFISRRR